MKSIIVCDKSLYRSVSMTSVSQIVIIAVLKAYLNGNLGFYLSLPNSLEKQEIFS